MVPSSFSTREVDSAIAYLKERIQHKAWMSKDGQRSKGNPLIFYSDLIQRLGYSIENESDGDRCGILAELLTVREYNTNQGMMLSAVLVSKEYLRPGIGFYKLAEELGLFTRHGKRIDPDGTEELQFWTDQLNAVVKAYGIK